MPSNNGTIQTKAVSSENKDILSTLAAKAKKGDIASQKKLAEIYKNGYNGVAVNKNLSFRWTLEAAKAGDRDSMFFIASTYENVTPKTQEYTSAAVSWYGEIVNKNFSQKDTIFAANKIKTLQSKIPTKPIKSQKMEIAGVVSKNRVNERDDDDPKVRADALYRQAQSLYIVKDGQLIIPDGNTAEILSLYDQAAALGHELAAEKAKALRAYLYD